MKHLILIYYFVMIGVLPSLSQVRYHILEMTTTDPKIEERCVEFDKIIKMNCGYIKETLDKQSRCIKLEFYKNKNTFFQAVDLPSIVEFTWTDSSLIEVLFSSDHSIFSSEMMVRPNKEEYFIRKNKIYKIQSYFNDKLIKTVLCEDSEIHEKCFSMMYSDCDKKYNRKYRIQF